MKQYELYRHFKGGVYRALREAEHSETGERLVIYERVETGEVFARPWDMFFSEVDLEKYPDAEQKYRFEIINHPRCRKEKLWTIICDY